MTTTTSCFTNHLDALAFILGGNSRFTLVSKATGTRYTYRVKASDDGKVLFASVMYGPDNGSDYVYMGVIRGKTLVSTAKSKVGVDDPRVTALRWALVKLFAGNMPAQLEVWHEGACGRCNRALTVPSSIASGIGPECAKKIGQPILCEAA